jgi:protein SCO1
MKNPTAARILIACCLLTLGGAAENAPPASGAVARMQHRLLNIALSTQENRKVRFYDDLVKGKVVVISFMFTGCQGICPRTTATMVKLQNALGDRVGKDIFLYSISLDAEHDTPDVLRQYANSFGAKPGWTFLTGQREEIEQLRRSLGMYDPDPVVDADKTQHGGLLVLGNEPIGRWFMVPALQPPDRIMQSVLRMLPGKKRAP